MSDKTRFRPNGT